ncbi:ead/Ea22-like family protein [Klebsiella pneumoniae]|uniref:ead/Ea22-like family protein n=1 Tax=Klebsiella pneumoniae TaxID=573 RepID=UPI002AF6B9E5|nr:ead/Ea22-like family protein [Klebsiella pneumoniae]
MTDITELAQSLKAAAEKATPGCWEYYPGNTSIEYNVDSMDEDQGSIVYVDSGDFTQAQTDRNGEFIALANPANVLALVEALEKAQAINAAAEKLVRCKGRYHSELNYRALAALFGVNTPDLPPLEHENVHYVDAAEMEIAALRQRIAELESRTVKLPKRFCPEEYEGSLLWSETEVWNQAISACNGALRTAGIKVEDE